VTAIATPELLRGDDAIATGGSGDMVRVGGGGFLELEIETFHVPAAV
jgi:hypothetical protein